MSLSHFEKHEVAKIAKFWCFDLTQQHWFTSNFYKMNKQKHCTWITWNKLNAKSMGVASNRQEEAIASSRILQNKKTRLINCLVCRKARGDRP